MEPSAHSDDPHLADRVSWLRAAVMGDWGLRLVGLLLDQPHYASWFGDGGYGGRRQVVWCRRIGAAQ